MSDLRPSPIAGTWYPGDAEALARSVDKQLAEAELEPAPGPGGGVGGPPRRMTELGIVRVARDTEHSLEIELPFLQRCLAGPFRLLPIMLRDQSTAVAQAVGRALSEVLRGQSALVVGSSDLSHFYPAATARRLAGG